MSELLPCPFCGQMPLVGPIDPEKDGDAFGYVYCANKKCPAEPTVQDGEDVADDRGSDEYKRIAIERWNTRTPSIEDIVAAVEAHRDMRTGVCEEKHLTNYAIGKRDGFNESIAAIRKLYEVNDG